VTNGTIAIMPQQGLQGTTVLVTGGAGGLGKAISMAYLDAGANVAVCDINEDLLASTRAELEPTGRFLGVKTDITDETAMQQLVDETVAKFGRLDVLVNNAGIMDRFDPVAELDRQVWDRLLNVNLTGSFLSAKAAVNAFLKQEQGGLVIQIGSNASYAGHTSGLAYSVSKHGVQALVKHTASYYGDQGI
jgi:NAD(P)-dependent dehydrogenase (short-subunit alcohol dehydrogenase family)